MPREEVCPKCGGSKFYIGASTLSYQYGDPCNCNDGKITLYTQEELDAAIEAAVLKEREECKEECLLFARFSDGSPFDTGYKKSAHDCAEAIEARGSK